MNYLHGLILGVIEGLTEFLPISSTAHLVIFSNWLRLPSSDFLKTFEISIQLGAILAVVVLYWKRIWSGWDLIGRIAAAFIPTAIIGLVLYKLVKNFLLDNLWVIAFALLIGGVILIILEKYYGKKTEEKKSEENLSYRQAFLIGLCQSLAIIPGVSRAAATIMGGLGLGVKRREIVEFSFLLAIPTMLAATGLDLIKSRDNLASLGTTEITIWLTGFLAAFLTAIAGVRFFLRFIKQNNFVPFGWYRIALGLVVMAWILLK